MITLNISQQFGQIGLRITPPQYDLKIQPPDLSVRQTPATITLEQPAAILNIDYTPAREAIGYAGIVDNQKQFDQLAEATYDEGIERRVREGREAASLKNHIPLKELFAENVRPKEKNLTLVPVPPIRITVQQQSIQWGAVMGGVSVQLTHGTVHGNLQYGQVKGYLEKDGGVQIQAVGTIWDHAV